MLFGTLITAKLNAKVNFPSVPCAYGKKYEIFKSNYVFRRCFSIYDHTTMCLKFIYGLGCGGGIIM